MAAQYYDLSSFADSETKRALARVIAKREGKSVSRGDRDAGGDERRKKKQKKH
jgi:pre-mRNA-splicing factor ATP-dependent RNA helicase DHX15/PRP43